MLVKSIFSHNIIILYITLIILHIKCEKSGLKQFYQQANTTLSNWQLKNRKRAAPVAIFGTVERNRDKVHASGRVSSLLNTRNSFSNPAGACREKRVLRPLWRWVYVMEETSSLVARQYNVEYVNPVKPNTVFSAVECSSLLHLSSLCTDTFPFPPRRIRLNSPSPCPLPSNPRDRDYPAVSIYTPLFFNYAYLFVSISSPPVHDTRDSIP